jgi:hypothetical protein
MLARRAHRGIAGNLARMDWNRARDHESIRDQKRVSVSKLEQHSA